MTSKFTPGPWVVVKHERFPFQREVKAEDGYICDMEGLSDDDMPTVAANANLIAAAPEIYEALKNLCNGSTAIRADDWDRAEAALAKAEGRQ